MITAHLQSLSDSEFPSVGCLQHGRYVPSASMLCRMTRLDGVVEHLPGPLCGQSSALKPWHITQPHCRSVRAAPPGDLQRRYVPATGTRSPGIVISGLPQPQYESQIRHSQSTLQRLNPPRIDSPTPQLPIAIHRFTFILHPHRRHVFRRHLPRLPRAPLPAAAG